MIFNSDLIFRLARGLGGVTLGAGDGELAVPTFLMPTVALRGPIARIGGFSANDNQRETIATSGQLGRAASQAATSQRLMTLARGMWELTWGFSLLATWTQASDDTVVPAGRLRLQDPAAGVAVFAEAYAVNAVPQIRNGKFIVLLTEEGWFVDISVGATGVAQTHQANATLLASRLT